MRWRPERALVRGAVGLFGLLGIGAAAASCAKQGDGAGAGGAGANAISGSSQAAPARAGGNLPSGWSRRAPVTMNGVGAYSIAVPADLAGGPVQGIDSLVAEYRRPGLRLSFDFGMYGALPDCRAHRCSRIEIDGLPAILARAEQAETPGAAPHPWLHLQVPLPRPDRPGAISLVAYANCAAAADCATAQQVFESIDFNLEAAGRPE